MEDNYPLPYIDYNTAADDLAMQGARSSEAMMMLYIPQNILLSAS